jgi:hypothetical protein
MADFGTGDFSRATAPAALDTTLPPDVVGGAAGRAVGEAGWDPGGRVPAWLAMVCTARCCTWRPNGDGHFSYT